MPLCEPGKCVGLCIGSSVQCPGLCQVPIIPSWPSTPKACLRDGGNNAKCQLRMQCTTICLPFLQSTTQHFKDVARCCLLVFYMLTDRRLARARFTVLKPVPGSGSRANCAQFHGSSDVKHVSSWFQPWATLWPTCHMLVPASFLLNV